MSDDLERLQRWVDSGAHVRVVGRRGERLTVSMVTCDGGEEMDRVVSADPRLAAWCAENALPAENG